MVVYLLGESPVILEVSLHSTHVDVQVHPAPWTLSVGENLRLGTKQLPAKFSWDRLLSWCPAKDDRGAGKMEYEALVARS